MWHFDCVVRCNYHSRRLGATGIKAPASTQIASSGTAEHIAIEMRFSLFFVLALAVLLVSTSNSIQLIIKPIPTLLHSNWWQVKWLCSMAPRLIMRAALWTACLLPDHRHRAHHHVVDPLHHHAPPQHPLAEQSAIYSIVNPGPKLDNENDLLYSNPALYHMKHTSIKQTNWRSNPVFHP